MLDKELPLYFIVFALTFAITALTERLLIPYLSGRAQQPIYGEGPSWHMSKSGTPTMGGLAFLIGISVSLLSASLYLFLTQNIRAGASLLLCLGYSVLNSSVGIIDDIKKLRNQQNTGLTPLQKLALQAIIAALFLLGRGLLLKSDTIISFSFGELNLGPLYYPLALLILLGITNCANLTDGIDGLASSVAFAIGISLFYISYSLSTETTFLSSSLIGAALAFLIFNIHPARVFMGDTGSLLLGSLAVSGCFMLDNPLISIAVGGIYVIEGISVILQVLVFKVWHKRLFRMSPIHHHFEKLGWGEDKICITALLLTFALSIPAFILYLP